VTNRIRQDNFVFAFNWIYIATNNSRYPVRMESREPTEVAQRIRNTVGRTVSPAVEAVTAVPWWAIYGIPGNPS